MRVNQSVITSVFDSGFSGIVLCVFWFSISSDEKRHAYLSSSKPGSDLTDLLTWRLFWKCSIVCPVRPHRMQQAQVRGCEHRLHVGGAKRDSAECCSGGTDVF